MRKLPQSLPTWATNLEITSVCSRLIYGNDVSFIDCLIPFPVHKYNNHEQGQIYSHKVCVARSFYVAFCLRELFQYSPWIYHNAYLTAEVAGEEFSYRPTPYRVTDWWCDGNIIKINDSVSMTTRLSWPTNITSKLLLLKLSLTSQAIINVTMLIRDDYKRWCERVRDFTHKIEVKFDPSVEIVV